MFMVSTIEVAYFTIQKSGAILSKVRKIDFFVPLKSCEVSTLTALLEKVVIDRENLISQLESAITNLPETVLAN